MYLFYRNNRVHCIKVDSITTANYFQNRRWQLVTLLEQLSGRWPHQNKLKRYPLQLFHSFFQMVILATVMNKLRESVAIDTNMSLECLLFMGYLFCIYIKLIFGSIDRYSRRKVYERIIKHFETIIDPEEVAVLNEGAERGFKYTVYYAGVMLIMVVIFDSVPILRAFYDYFYGHCELKLEMPMPMNFGFDHYKYWYIIAFIFLISANSSIVANFAYDSAFMLQIRHAKALFKIVGIRLRKASDLTEEFENEIMSDDAADEAYSLISSAIDLHSECIELVKLIEDCYTTSYFLILLLSTLAFGGATHLMTTKFHDPIETFRYSAAFTVILLHFQVVFSQGQIIIDSAESVLKTCGECKWYRLPKKSRNLLSMMMIRTSIPCQLTGAKLFPLSMETFTKMLKAGLSYYTVFKARFR